MRLKQQLKLNRLLWLVVLILHISFINPPSAKSQGAVVRCVLFYSPTCPHCHEVITETLPPLVDSFGGTPEVQYIPPTPEEEPLGPSLVRMYGETLEILYINTLTEVGRNLYRETVEKFQIPREDQVVPLMIIDEVILIGGNEIPQRFSELIDTGIAAGGVIWPDLPGLKEVLTSLIDLPTPDESGEDQATESVNQESTSGEIIAESTATAGEGVPIVEPPISPVTTQLAILDKLRLDPIGNAVAILVLFVMLATVGYVGIVTSQSPPETERKKPSYLIPVLTIIGVLIAGYLTYVETSGELAVCGPIGDCNFVQQSQYSRLFGLIPVGVLGLLGYIAISITWLFARYSSGVYSVWSDLLLFTMATIGILFSIYLTFLEPFVIGASCSWCLSSAAIITLLFWLSKDNGRNAFNLLRNK